MSDGYRRPPAPIPDILEAEPIPGLSLSPSRDVLALFDRRALTDLTDLARPEIGLAGVRIDPRTAGPSREAYYYGISFTGVEPGAAVRRVPLPPEPRISTTRWSPNGTHLAFLMTRDDGIELWVADVAAAHARRLLGPEVSAVLGSAYHWLPDGRALLVKRVSPPAVAPPLAPGVPTGPVIQESTGVAAPARTYQDLLATPHDEALFEHHFTSEILLVPLDGSDPVHIGQPGIYSDVSPAPDGDYVLVERIKRPYSYLVPWHRFPAEVEILDMQGATVRRVADLPLAEDVPVAFDAVPAGPRSFHWRSDAPATLVWAEALDGGDPRVDAAERDVLMALDAPFSDPPTPLITLEHRYAGTVWGTPDLALVYSRWWSTRWLRGHRIRPSTPDAAPEVVFDRSYEDRYGDPGSPVLTRTASGQTVLLTPDGESIYLNGDGASPRGNYPFLDRLDLRTGETSRLWEADDPWYEAVAAVLDPDATRVITRRESADVPPNYHLEDLTEGTSHPLTHFTDPAPQLAGIGRELIHYERSDGVHLSGTLYTPPGYAADRDGPLPLLMWAYPREYLDPEAAGQVDDSPNRFSRPAGSSPLFLLTQGYALLDGPAMPIVRTNDQEPNDNYIEQLVMGAEAAVEAVVARGWRSGAASS